MFLRPLFAVFLTLLAAPLAAAPAVKGDVPTEVIVDLSDQKMTVIREGQIYAEWPVSTARRGKVTPKGSWSPNFLSKHHKSSRYNNAPMPFSIFYSGNFAIHGTDQVSKLGQPASAGCVRLSPENASVLFGWVADEGLKSMRITVTD